MPTNVELNDVIVPPNKNDSVDSRSSETKKQVKKVADASTKTTGVRPKSVQQTRLRKNNKIRPSTVHSKTGLARERSKFLKAEKREHQIDNDLTKKEKKRGHTALTKLDVETRSGVIHGNAKRAFYNKLKEKLSIKNEVDIYDSILVLEILSEDSDNHFDILQHRLLHIATEVINRSKTWSLQQDHLLHLVPKYRNLLAH